MSETGGNGVSEGRSVNSAASGDGAANRGRGALIGLAALFFVPLFIAFALYYGGGWRPAESTNHGALVSPPIPLEAPWPRENWTLFYVAPAVCDDACRNALVVMRQSRLALAQEATRVQRVLIAPADCCDSATIAREHPGLLTIGSDTAVGVLRALPAGGSADTLYLVDPLGNLMMTFDARENPKGLLADLKKLLRLSHIG
jgi:hypothetical protein